MADGDVIELQSELPVPKLTISYMEHPGRAVLRTPHDHVILEARGGAIERWMIDSAMQMTEVPLHIVLEGIAGETDDQPFDTPTMHTRKVWFDDKHGNFVVHVDLIHNFGKPPPFTVEQIRAAYPNVCRNGQMVSVEVRMHSEVMASDSYFGLAPRYYKGL